MNKKILHLHMGPPKTGTTSIQNALFTNAGGLKEEGFFVPTFEQNHRFLVSAFMQDPEVFDYNLNAGRSGAELAAYHKRRLEEFETGLDESGCDQAVISAEHMVLLERAEVKRLHDYLSGLFSDIRLYLYIRHPCDQVGSLIQERVKNGVVRLRTIYSSPFFFRYSKILPPWGEFFGTNAVHLRLYSSDQLIDGDVASDFLDWIGARRSDWLVNKKRANESLSHPAVLIADALTVNVPKGPGRRAAQKYLKEIRGPRFVPPPHVIARVRRRSSGEVAYLRDQWGLEVPEVQIPPRSGAVFSDETVASLADLLDRLARMVESRNADAATPSRPGRRKAGSSSGED